MKVTKRGVGAALFTLLAAAICVRLGIWQLHRLAERRASNAELVHATALPPLALGDDLSAITRAPDRYVDRRARVTGAYIPGRDLVLRGRALQGEPGVNLVGALRVAGSDTVVLVDRGWVSANDAASVDPAAYPAPGTVTVSGILRPMPVIEQGPKPATLTVGGHEVHTVQRLDLPTLRRHSREAIVPLYLQVLPDSVESAALPRPVPIPPLSEGPHLSYAIQWFSFAAIGIIGFLIVAFRRSRNQP